MIASQGVYKREPLQLAIVLSMALILAAAAVTMEAAGDRIFCSTNDEPVKAKEILNNSRYYVGLFKPEAEKETPPDGLYPSII